MLNFKSFLKAVEEFDLKDNLSQAAMHTSAVCVSDWELIENAGKVSEPIISEKF